LVKAGTIFDRSRISLQEWCAAARYMTNEKHGVSVLGQQCSLELGSYQMVWTTLQKLSTTMVRPGREGLRGSVEVDEKHMWEVFNTAFAAVARRPNSLS